MLFRSISRTAACCITALSAWPLPCTPATSIQHNSAVSVSYNLLTACVCLSDVCPRAPTPPPGSQADKLSYADNQDFEDEIKAAEEEESETLMAADSKETELHYGEAWFHGACTPLLAQSHRAHRRCGLWPPPPPPSPRTVTPPATHPSRCRHPRTWCIVPCQKE
jgi:hypothetical protein